MKKNLFLLIFILSINASARSQIPLSDKRYPVFNSFEIAAGRIEENGDLKGVKNMPALKHQLSDQQTIIQLNDSIYRWIWDDLTLSWKGYDKTIDIVYNDRNSIESLVHCWMYTTTWDYDKKTVYTYDASNNLTSELIQLWHGTYHYFYDFERHSYTYDLQNNVVHALWQVSNTEGADWENTIQVINTYDNTKNQSTSLHQTWSGTGWVNDYIITKIYDADHKVISIVEQRWIEGDWENAIRWDYSYDSNNNEISCLYQFWKSGSWGNAVLYTSAYDENFNRTNYLYQYWISGFWEDKFQIISAYDDNNNLISEYGLNWNGNAWINSFRRTFTYEKNNFLKSRTNKNWDITGTVIQSADSTFNYFHLVTGINGNKDQSEKVIVYPNPTSDFLCIETQFAWKTFNADVFSIYGKLLLRKELVTPQAKLDIRKLNSGIYYLQITDGNYKIITRFIKK